MNPIQTRMTIQFKLQWPLMTPNALSETKTAMNSLQMAHSWKIDPSGRGLGQNR